MKKKSFTRNLVKVLVLVGILIGFLYFLSQRYVVPIMMYHNVQQSTHYVPNTVSPQNFADHMAFLKKNNFKVLSLDELVNIIQSGKPLPRKSAVITFDDGYEDNYIYAYPILKKYNFPAIIFVPSDQVDTKGFLTTDQIKEMMQHGIAIGSHTRTQAYLPNESYESQKDQIFESKRIIEEKFSQPVQYIAYPTGGFSEQIKALVKEAGYKGACTTNRGFDKSDKDVYELNRIRFGDRDIHDYNLWAKLSGYYNFLRKTKKPY